MGVMFRMTPVFLPACCEVAPGQPQRLDPVPRHGHTRDVSGPTGAQET
jgi:hypothetical protein